MKFIDTHSHLYSEQFDKDRSKTIADAIALGVGTILLPNISSKYTEGMLALCDEFPNNCYPMMGLHPCDVTKKNYDMEIAHVEKELATGDYIGVGEIGLDLYWDKTTLEIQKKAFVHQVELAKKHQLPIAIHVRDSFNEAIEIIESLNSETLRGVFHCFTGNKDFAEKLIKIGCYISISGIITFKNSNELVEAASVIPDDKLLVETDSPYLSPIPNRGKNNEPSFITHTIEKLSIIRNVDKKIVIKNTTNNFKKLFKLK